MKPLLSLLSLLMVGLCASADDSIAAKFQPLLESTCLDCHGPDVQKAGLRLDTLGADLTDAHTFATWVKVHDKIVSGEMPPKKSEPPPKMLLRDTTMSLHQHLTNASRSRQQANGRVVLRRLNSTEYENTLNDLLDLHENFRDLFPEEGSAGGFDNVSAALELSSTHLLLYQEAAEKAIRATIPSGPPIPFSDRRTGRVMTEKGSNFRQKLTRSCYLDGDSLIVYSELPRYGLCCTASVPADGRYKVRMSIAAVGAAKKPVPVAFMTVQQSSRDEPVLQELREVNPGDPQLIELEIDLVRGQGFVVNLLHEWDIRAFKKPIEEYTGPGMRLDWLSIEGPVQDFPPTSYNRLFQGVPLRALSEVTAEHEGKKPRPIPANRTSQQWLRDPLVPASRKPKEDAERLLRDFLPRAFRRPVSEELQQFYVSRVWERLDRKETFFDAMLFGYKSILSSPHFLLFVEDADETGRLDDYALANRLAYFLWSGPPDAELLAVAKRGDLAKPEVLRTQMNRLLADPKAARFTENFCGQWLDLREINATIPDPQLYADFDGLLLWAMPRETHLYFEEVLQNNRSLLEFVDSDWTILNERLARHYGIPGVEGNAMRKVMLPAGSGRGGLLTQASVLKVTADGTRTSPVLRGKWVLDRILGTPPSPPPPDLPTIEPDIRGATTIRQQLEKHRSLPSCATCHIHIDPPGFAMEAFDPIGGYRERYRTTTKTRNGTVSFPGYSGRPIYLGLEVELGGQTPDGHTFTTINEYKKLLLAEEEQLARNLVEKMMTYSTGAEVQFADREIVNDIVAKLKTKNYGFRTLMDEVVQSRVFRHK